MEIRSLGRSKTAVGPSRRAPVSASILIVDDATTMRTIIRGMLSQLGFQNVDDAEDGEDALRKMQSKPYNLIISDWHMAPMNGIELLKRVRKSSRPGQVKFIFSTSETSWGSKTTAKLEGAEEFISKPFTVEMLQQKIAAVLRS